MRVLGGVLSSFLSIQHRVSLGSVLRMSTSFEAVDEPEAAAAAAVVLFEYVKEKYGGENGMSGSAAKRMVRRKQIFVNGKAERLTNYNVQAADVIELRPTRERSGDFSEFGLKETVRLKVCYEDDHIAVIVKPPGMPVHSPLEKKEEHVDGFNVRSVLLTNLKAVTTPGLNPLHRPQPVHRLDRDTHGLLLCAKTRAALTKCGEMFKERDVEKEYLAIVAGVPKKLIGSIDAAVDNKEALSHYRVADDASMAPVLDPAGRSISTLVVKIETGRKNQIRRHLAGISHPIMGDTKCWRQPEWDRGHPSMKDFSQGLCLSAVKIRFPHPMSGEDMTFSIPEPEHFSAFRAAWATDTHVMKNDKNDKVDKVDKIDKGTSPTPYTTSGAGKGDKRKRKE